MRKSKKFKVSDGDFVKSSWSKNNPKTCVMVAVKPKGVAVRDSQDPPRSTRCSSAPTSGVRSSGARRLASSIPPPSPRPTSRRASESLPVPFLSRNFI
ncbi:MAG: DUF397 domain-containing protein [Patescibacteria group bacterium]